MQAAWPPQLFLLGDKDGGQRGKAELADGPHPVGVRGSRCRPSRASAVCAQTQNGLGHEAEALLKIKKKHYET